MPVVSPGLGVATPAATTLAGLRNLVAERLNAHVQPPAPTGNVSALVTDNPRSAFLDRGLNEEDDVLTNSFLLFTGGVNAGTYRQIAGNAGERIDLRRPFANAINLLDPYDIYRRWSPAQFTTAINVAIRDAFPFLYTHMEVEVPEDPTTTEYALPAGMVELRQLRRRVNPQSVTGSSTTLIGSPMLLGAALARDTVYTSIQVQGNQIANIAAGQIFQIDNGFGDSQTVVLGPGSITYDGSSLTTIPVVTPTTGSVLVGQGQSTAPFEAVEDFAVGTPVQAMSTAITPPVYVDLRGEWWEPQADRVRVHYRPAYGQYLLMVGYGALAELANDTDSTTLPVEVIIAGACQSLYEQLFASETGASAAYWERQAKMWNTKYEELKRRYAQQTIPYETHPPRVRIVRGWVTDLGPIQS